MNLTVFFFGSTTDFLLHFVPFPFCLSRSVLGEVSLRAGIALNQKRIVHDITFDGSADEVDEDFEKEFATLAAQVVRLLVIFTHLGLDMLRRFAHPFWLLLLFLTGQGNS